MVKVIAGILLFFGCTALGFSKASGYKNRRVELEDTLELIRLLHLDISYRKDALAKTFQRAALPIFSWGWAGAIPGGSSRSWSRHFIAWSSRSAKRRNWNIKWEKCTEAWGWQPV